ncbi:MAG TPA: hypothetical protein VGG69_03125 [Rhizomicrobium sp.]|jgi:hypothetical protein
MSLAPEPDPPQIVLRSGAEAWLAWLQHLLLRTAAVATSAFVEPSAAIADAVKTALTKVDKISDDQTTAIPETSAMHRHPHVLNAATNLLGICFIIIGGLKLTNQNSRTWSDEIAWGAAFFLVVSIVLSYSGIRNGSERQWTTRMADWSFMVGIAALIVSMVIAAYQL